MMPVSTHITQTDVDRPHTTVGQRQDLQVSAGLKFGKAAEANP